MGYMFPPLKSRVLIERLEQLSDQVVHINLNSMLTQDVASMFVGFLS
jgi:hypothetical protein